MPPSILLLHVGERSFSETTSGLFFQNLKNIRPAKITGNKNEFA
jgi:hypothetical protein